MRFFPCQIWQVPTLQVIHCISACVYAALKSSISENNSLKSAYTQADIQWITCSVGTCHIWHGKKRMTAHILSYRRIRRYLALSLKATEEHVTLVM